MCGIAGVYNVGHASKYTFHMLHALQPRGHDGAGIASTDGDDLFVQKGPGRVVQAFRNVNFKQQLLGDMAIGNNRYATTGKSSTYNLHPFVMWLDMPYGREKVAIVHNGNITNYEELREEVITRGCIVPDDSSDTRIMLYLIYLSQKETLYDRIRDACSRVQGAFAFLIMSTKGFFAFTDPQLFHPLVMGREGNDSYYFASEDVAFHALNDATLARIDDIAHLNGGEIVAFFNVEGQFSREKSPHFMGGKPRDVRLYVNQPRQMIREARVPAKRSCHCTFEHIYLAARKSTPFGMPSEQVQRTLGASLAQWDFQDSDFLTELPDLVLGVPNSGLWTAECYANEFAELYKKAYHKHPGLTYHQRGIMVNEGVDRTFIEPNQSIRETLMKRKFNIDVHTVQGKSIVVIDDSIVRGTTMRTLVRQLRECGARAIHLRSAAPKLIHECIHGVNIETTDELIAAQHTVEEIRALLDVDSLKFNTIPGLLAAVGDPYDDRSCTTCFSGSPPDTDSYAMKLKLPIYAP
ncbi:amidophosphoribosyltransferase [Candidatus Uhrbacteria bacterium]|nr:amidophosphoribosyltransferase [Candidatus Uhrbacteria bacterium]